jgi:hypothetical protein
MTRLVRAPLCLALVGGVAAKTVPIEVATKESGDGPCCAGTCPDSNKNKYFSIANDSGPWLCGETCIRDSFYPIFHLFEKNLTKATDMNVCKDAGYTKYKSTVTHGGGGLDCTLDLYECARPEGCDHPGTSVKSVPAAPLSPSTKTVSLEVTTKESDEPQCCAGPCSDSAKNKYFSIADDSGPWLCGETCIRDSFYPIFHIFEKNLTKATDMNVCKDAGYTKYKSTVTHGGGGLDCTLDLYECAKPGGCEHPGANASPIFT